MSNLNKILLNKNSCKSIWFMRQAGRYLPEFREIRSKNTNFLKLCLNSELSSQITLQPIKRFNLDSAIIFSDILMIPYALGQNVIFTQNYGPRLSDFNLKSFMQISESEFIEKLIPIYKAIEITRKKLEKGKSLIGFIGAPWTLIVYMMDLKENKTKLKINKLNKYNFDSIIDKITSFSCIHLKKQIEAGVDVVQIFDSWAGLLPEQLINNYCLKPNLEIVKFCKKYNIPSICFPKGINKNYLEFNDFVKPDGINLDPEINPDWAKKKLKNVVVQGGLDPKLLLESEENMLEAATRYIDTFKLCLMYLIRAWFTSRNRS